MKASTPIVQEHYTGNMDRGQQLPADLRNIAMDSLFRPTDCRKISTPPIRGKARLKRQLSQLTHHQERVVRRLDERESAKHSLTRAQRYTDTIRKESVTPSNLAASLSLNHYTSADIRQLERQDDTASTTIAQYSEILESGDFVKMKLEFSKEEEVANLRSRHSYLKQVLIRLMSERSVVFEYVICLGCQVDDAQEKQDEDEVELLNVQMWLQQATVTSKDDTIEECVQHMRAIESKLADYPSASTMYPAKTQ